MVIMMHRACCHTLLECTTLAYFLHKATDGQGAWHCNVSGYALAK